MKINIKSLLFHTLVPLMLAFTITMLIGDYKPYLESLTKPLELPGYVFFIAWTILYLIMGISAYFIDNTDDNKSMKLYYIQLIINLAYPFVFFYLHNILFATIMTIAMLVLSIIIAIKFYKIKKVSGLLFIIYILWLLLANYIQIGIYYLN